ncbi:hypothetical protein BU24DRAFT_146124 [Aaosphaeria arxii CBS 175.79]|uniref:Uncharacterized protein n=1 Tax=Aaosphaeria arxii CBS 175.79 TaxID=1450172 RepID=A0A6A5XV77_9PLEO|nr:uncharacterized protein BU24DRAFT_146124 [Aaosphaeria arxii CBS 175.79]KAF2017218.1 hypothetical protein BU24DRAFT_146124 [Aaosphaeria arxii CBS 175.79]
MPKLISPLCRATEFPRGWMGGTAVFFILQNFPSTSSRSPEGGSKPAEFAMIAYHDELDNALSSFSFQFSCDWGSDCSLLDYWTCNSSTRLLKPHGDTFFPFFRRLFIIHRLWSALLCKAQLPIRALGSNLI